MILNLPPPTEYANFRLVTIGRLLPRIKTAALPLKEQDKILCEKNSILLEFRDTKFLLPCSYFR